MMPNNDESAAIESATIQDEKLQWEIRKLKVETENLSSPFKRQPAFWLSLAALALSVFGNITQLSSAERLRQLAEIKKERLELDAMALERRTAELNMDIASRQQAVNATQLELENNSARLAKLKSDIADATVSRAALIKQVDEAQQSSSTTLTVILQALAASQKQRGGRK